MTPMFKVARAFSAGKLPADVRHYEIGATISDLDLASWNLSPADTQTKVAGLVREGMIDPIAKPAPQPTPVPPEAPVAPPEVVHQS